MSTKNLLLSFGIMAVLLAIFYWFLNVWRQSEITAQTYSNESNKSSIQVELNWKSRTYSGVLYVFGVWNPNGTNKNPEDSSQWNMTSEIEHLVYAFLVNPIIRESSIKCAQYFWKDENDGRPIYNTWGMHEDMWEISSENWWNPYSIDINKLILLNVTNGRKELNIAPIWTLRTQISFPAVKLWVWWHYTNIQLTECLKKNNLLESLQSHVEFYYKKLSQLWTWGFIEM